MTTRMIISIMITWQDARDLFCRPARQLLRTHRGYKVRPLSSADHGEDEDDDDDVEDEDVEDGGHRLPGLLIHLDQTKGQQEGEEHGDEADGAHSKIIIVKIVIGGWFFRLVGENRLSSISPSEFSSFKDIVKDCEHIFWHILSGHCPNANFSQWMASPCSETAINRDWVCPH